MKHLLHPYDPETDAPALGQATTLSSRDLFLIAFVLPVALALAIKLVTALISTPKGSGGKPAPTHLPPGRPGPACQRQTRLHPPPPCQPSSNCNRNSNISNTSTNIRPPGSAPQAQLPPTQ